MSIGSPSPGTLQADSASGRRRRPFRTAFLALALVLAVLLGLLVASVAFQRSDEGSYTVAEPVDEVVLDLSAGNAEVVAWDEDDVRVEYRRRYLWREPELAREATAGVLRLGGSCRGLIAVVCSIDLRVSVPADTLLSGGSSAGNLTVDGLTADVDLRTSAGNVTASDLTAAVRLRSSAGDVIARRVSGPVVEARSSAGDVEVTALAVPDRVAAQTSAGNIDIIVPHGAYRVDTTTSAGDVDVAVISDPDAPRTIEARTSAGDIRISGR